MSDAALLRDFRTAIAGPEDRVDLFGACMAIAGLGQWPPDVDGTARQLDMIADAARKHAGSASEPEELAHAIDFQLFTVLGFHGNNESFRDPACSYLDQVVARRTGLPITLSVVYMEIARRVGLSCAGIGYPGHFIVRAGSAARPIFIDPFHQGTRLDLAELRASLATVDLGRMTPEALLCALTPRQILQRMLNNLRTLFRDRRSTAKWLTTVELSLSLEPWNAMLVGERGMLNYRAGNYPEALRDLERYVGAVDMGSVTSGALRLLGELRDRLGSEDFR